MEGTNNTFAVPTVFLNNGEYNKLDDKDFQKDGEIVYFGDAKVTNATLKVLDKDAKEVTSVKGNNTDTAKFVYQSVDQNGKNYGLKDGKSYTASFQVTAGFNAITANGTPIAAGETKTITATSTPQGEVSVTVVGSGVTSAKVSVSAAQYSLPNLDASVSFTDSKALPAYLYRCCD